MFKVKTKKPERRHWRLRLPLLILNQCSHLFQCFPIFCSKCCKTPGNILANIYLFEVTIGTLEKGVKYVQC